MITGAHIILFSKDADADRAFIRDHLGFAHVDAGGGWFIFKLPPSELAFHPGHENGATEFYLMCVEAEMASPRLGAPAIRSARSNEAGSRAWRCPAAASFRSTSPSTRRRSDMDPPASSPATPAPAGEGAGGPGISRRTERLPIPWGQRYMSRN